MDAEVLALLRVAQGDRLDATQEIVPRRVPEEVVQASTVGGGDQLPSSLGDGAGGLGLQLGADLINDDDLRHVVLNGLDHDRVLQGGRAYLHTTRAADAVVWDVAVATDLIAGVDDDHPLGLLVGEHPGAFAQHGRLAHPRSPQEEDRAAAHHEVLDQVDRPGDCPTDAAGDPHDLALAVADGRYPVECPGDAGTVVVAKSADPLSHVLQVGARDGVRAEDYLGVGEASLGLASQVHADLQELVAAGHGVSGGVADGRRQGPEEQIELTRPVLVCLCHQSRTTMPKTGAMALSFLRWRAAAATLTRISRTSRSWPASSSNPASWSTRVVTVS